MLEQIKLNLRQTSDAFDEQIKGIIDFVKADLEQVGVINITDDDPIIVQAVTLKAKADFDYENKGDWYLNQYARLKTDIALRGDYIA